MAMPSRAAQPSWGLGVVSYLNAKPLIAGLDRDPEVKLIYDVPARLPVLLEEGAVDAALVPVIDLVRDDLPWQIVSDACLGCDGETLTVRVFSRKAADMILKLHVDGDSHTSVALARIIWRELYGTALEVLPFAGNETREECEAILLIGDKVVNRRPVGYEIETDLGSAWKSLTSLPFVFAVWAASRGIDVDRLGGRLSRARDAGIKAASMIAADFGPGMGWPVTLATRYLTKRLKFILGPRQRVGMETFLALAKTHDLVSISPRLVYA